MSTEYTVPPSPPVWAVPDHPAWSFWLEQIYAYVKILGDNVLTISGQNISTTSGTSFTNTSQYSAQIFAEQPSGIAYTQSLTRGSVTIPVPTTVPSAGGGVAYSQVELSPGDKTAYTQSVDMWVMYR